jgi:predicted Fe-Mo cluster-binding NifX family protein
MRKIAVPVVNNKLSAHFGHCEYFAFFTEENGVITKRENIPGPAHAPGVIPPWIAAQGATEIIAGGMGTMAQNLFIQNNVKVILGAAEIDPEQLVKDYIAGQLQAGNNSCDHPDGHGHGGDHDHHNH